MCPVVRNSREPILASLWGRISTRMAIRSLAGPGRALRASLPRLSEAAIALEPVYLGIQEGLEKLSGHSRNLVERSRELIGMATGRETGSADFERTMAVLAEPLDFLSATLQQMPEISAELEAVRAAVRQTMELETALSRTLAPLKFMQTMFRVESSILPAEARETFVTLAAEIGNLFERERQSFSTQFESLTTVERGLREATAGIGRHLRERGEIVSQRRAEIQSTLARMAGELKANVQRNNQLTETSADLGAAVNEAMVAMQAQDIVAQRLQHASDGLRDAAGALEAAQANPDAATLGKVPTLARIEAAQIDAVTAELQKSENALREAIAKVMRHIGGLDQECLLLSEFQHITVSVDGIVEMLLESLASVRAMTGETLAMARAHAEALRPAAETLAELTSQVDVVARSMARIALNAQIRAVRIGKQTGLEVLASRTAEVARQTLRLSEELGDGFSRTSARLSGALEILGALCESGRRASDGFHQAGASEEASLHAFRDLALDRLRGFSERLDRSRETAQQIAARLDLSGPRQKLASVREAVEALAAASDVLALPCSSNHAVTAERSYTMAGERVVHHRVLSRSGPETPAASQNVAESNIELF